MTHIVSYLLERTVPQRSAAAVLTAVASIILAAPATGQSAGNGFLLGPPAGSFSIRGGFAAANASSDLFSFSIERLTLNRRSFSGPTVDVDLAFAAGPRTDIVIGSSFAGTSTGSEFRGFVDQNNAAIRQNTSFVRVPVTASVRQYLTARGRQVGNFAWIPAKIAPFVGAGGGVTWYRFQQSGDFIDYKTNDVFPATFGSSGWAPTAKVAAGADFNISPRMALTGQAGYLWARGRLNDAFSGFNRIDLSGMSTTLGFSVRF